MRTEIAGASQLSAATRYELLVGVSNAIGMHRDPKELFGPLVRELYRVVPFNYIGVFIRPLLSGPTQRKILSTSRISP